jgi:hypothetical protein
MTDALAAGVPSAGGDASGHPPDEAQAPAVAFIRQQDWALIPESAKVDTAAARDEAMLYREHFRFARNERRPQACGPWVQAHRLGWLVRSPVTVTLRPLHQVELAPVADAKELATVACTDEIWRRESIALGVSRQEWLHLFQYRTAANTYENMFIPNGHGTVEWRLGWAARLDRDLSLLVLPAGYSREFDIPMGLLSASTLDRMGSMSVPVEPLQECHINRGDVIARLIIITRDTLDTKATYPG